MDLRASRWNLGDRVKAMGLPATVTAITYRSSGIKYEVKFDSGGANAVIDEADLQ